MFRSLLLAIGSFTALIGSAIAQGTPEADGCRYVYESGEWKLELYHSFGLTGTGPSAIFHDLTHMPSRLLFWKATYLDGEDSYGYVLHQFLRTAHVFETMLAVPSEHHSSYYGNVRTYEGTAQMTVLDPGSNWHWRTQGSFTHERFQQVQYYQHVITPDDASDDNQRLWEHLASGRSDQLDVDVIFTETDGEPIPLAATSMATAGFADLTQSMDAYIATLTATCPAARGEE